MPKPRIRILFVCLRGKIRSRTAAELVNSEYPEYEARHGGTDKTALQPITTIDLYWADVVVVMKDDIKRALRKKFPSMRGKPMVPLRCWDIFDVYSYNQDTLVDNLRQYMNGLSVQKDINV